MLLILLSSLVFQLAGTCLLYKTLHRRKKAFQERFAMTVSTCTGSILTLNISTTLTLILQTGFMTVVTLSVFIGCAIGFLFGALYKMQSLLAGLYNGIMGAIMGTMFGSVILEPELCGLPSGVAGNIALLAIFVLGTSMIMISLIHYALRV